MVANFDTKEVISMDYKALAEILFPDVTMTPDEVEAKFAKRELPEGAVVTRMAPYLPRDDQGSSRRGRKA